MQNRQKISLDKQKLPPYTSAIEKQCFINDIRVENKGDMEESPYSRFESSELILRDELAVDRTLLANERTLLSYLRAGVSLLIAGVSIMHFSYQGWFWTIGLACIPIGAVATIIGVSRYRRMNRAISLLRKQAKRAL
jgi:putative membrane protein